ncbi:MAG: hypothetical protein EBU85_08145, partial [Actinobacteria bacterium]|nr:hypothetical protein [Actinomycetota bacterium]
NKGSCLDKKGSTNVPFFEKAKVTATSEDLTSYMKFLEPLVYGQRVEQPIENGETTRKVMRSLNRAADRLNKRLVRIPSDASKVVFRVGRTERRKLNIPAEEIARRVAKAKATLAAKAKAE